MTRIGSTSSAVSGNNKTTVTSDNPWELYDERGFLIFRIDNIGNRYIGSRSRLQKVPRT